MLNAALLTLALMQPTPVEEPAARPGPTESEQALSPEEKRQRIKQALEEGLGPEFLALLSEHSIRYTGGGYRERTFKYRLFVPDGAGPHDQRPLLVWFHGLEEAGEENVRHLMHLSRLVFPPPRERERFPFFLLAVQCPRENPTWTTNSADADDMLNVLMVVLEKTIREYPIDVDRISVSGVSSGGNACWELALRQPEMFSAVAPLASGGAGVSRIESLANVPIWAFHSARDKGTSVDGVRETVASLRAVGGTAHLTEIQSGSHNCWDAAFEDYGLLGWLLSQKRGEKGKPPPMTLLAKGQAAAAWHKFTTGWTPMLVLGQVGIPLLVLFAIWSVARRKGKSRRH